MKNKFYIAVLSTCIALFACSGEDNGTQSVFEVDLIGTYHVTYSAVVGNKSDSVLLSITANTYSASHFGPDPRFCNSEGVITDYGTPLVTLSRQTVLGSGCDSLRIPEGTFEADYRSRGDTIVFERKVAVGAPLFGDSVFTLTLIQVTSP